MEFKNHKYIVKCLNCEKEMERNDNHFAGNVALVTVNWCDCTKTLACQTCLLYDEERNRIY